VVPGRADVYGVAVISAGKSRARLEKAAEILQVRHVPNKYAGLLIKHAIQATRAGHRCIAPRSLVPIGRTETWRENGGPGRLPASAGRVFASARNQGTHPPLSGRYCQGCPSGLVAPAAHDQVGLACGTCMRGGDRLPSTSGCGSPGSLHGGQR
jgi:hypothetical protein